MGRHKEWRQIAKRERRRRLRTLEARNRDCLLDYIACSDGQNWLKEQEALELFEIEQIEKTNLEENEKWMRAENIAMKQWKKLQDKKEKILQQRLEHETKLKLEWELEQEKKKKEEERLKEMEEKNRQKQEIFMQNLEEFLSGDSAEPPPELMVSRESKPEAATCPFFYKTACCRFGDQCSRNHKYPGISRVLLATNFYSHFGLENASSSEYDTDVMLEYEDSDTYKQYKEFFNDVLPEFEKFGRIVQFKVCHNYEKHLRGNAYVEYAELRCAVAAYRSLHSRWYGGKQLSLQFCTIASWKNAICGLQAGNRCPKGRACNFLHVFRNPNNMFSSNYSNNDYDHKRSRRTPPRTWRWSESPEVEIKRRRRSKSRDSNNRRRRRNEKDKCDSREKTKQDEKSTHDEEKNRRSHRSRRKSPERRKDRRSDSRND